MIEEQQPGLRELLETAQAALEEGRHKEATAACRHVLREYPDSITAMRLLGESYLEAGRPAEVARAFERVLACDPFNVLARVGLGVLAEDRGDHEHAIAQFRLAWEADPVLPQLRSELVRLYRKRYGVGGRLRLSRVSLANLHARNGELPRAIRQFQLLHSEEPGRSDVTIGLAQVLWRHDDAGEAEGLCRTLLATRPALIRPLLVLAALLGDLAQGDAAAAESDALLEQARAIDPDTACARELLALHPSPTLQRFVDAPVAMTPFDPAALVLDGTDELLGERTTGPGDEPFRWEDIAQGFAGESVLSKNTGTPELGGVASEDDVDALFAAIDRQLATVDLPDAPHLAGMLEGKSPAVTAPLVAWDDMPDDGMEPAPDEPTAVERLTANWDNIDNELAAARPSDEVPVGMTGMLGPLGEELLPFDVESDSEPVQEGGSTFDASQFSLPPLDDEDDEEIDPAFNTGALGMEIRPFDLDGVGPRAKTGGLTFSELLQQGRETAAPVAENDAAAALADVDSTFIPRDPATLSNDDWLVDLQSTAAMAADPVSPGAIPSEGVLAQTPAASPEAMKTPEGEDTLLSPEHMATVPTSATTTPSFATLLGREDSSAALPEMAADSELASSPLSPESPAAPGTPLAVQQSGVSASDDAREQQFTRPRAREYAPLTTEELAHQGAQAFETVRDFPAAKTAPDGPQFDAWVRGGASPLAPDEPGQVGEFRPFATDAINLDEWLMSKEEGSTNDRDTLLSGGDWLSGRDNAVSPSFAAEDRAVAPPNFAGLSDTSTVGPPPVPAAPGPFNGDSRAGEPLRWPEGLPVLAGSAAQQSVVARAGEPQPYTNGYRAGVFGQEAAAAPIPARDVPGSTQVEAQHHTDQLAILETLVKADPSNHFARLMLAVAYSDGFPERALNEYRRLIKESDELVPEVVERLKEMIADGGAPARAYRVLGDAYMKLGQFDLAMAEFQRALTTRTRPVKS